VREGYTPIEKAHRVAAKIVRGTAPKVIELLGEDRYRELMLKDAIEMEKRHARVRGEMQKKSGVVYADGTLAEKNDLIVTAMADCGERMTVARITKVTKLSETSVRNGLKRLIEGGVVSKSLSVQKSVTRPLTHYVLRPDYGDGIMDLDKRFLDAMHKESTSGQIAELIGLPVANVSARLAYMYRCGTVAKRVTTRQETGVQLVLWKRKG